jgi:hypothetical protein
MTESLSPFGAAVTQVVSHWTGKKAHSIRNEVLGLVLEQSAAGSSPALPRLWHARRSSLRAA